MNSQEIPEAPPGSQKFPFTSGSAGIGKRIRDGKLPAPTPLLPQFQREGREILGIFAPFSRGAAWTFPVAVETPGTGPSRKIPAPATQPGRGFKGKRQKIPDIPDFSS